MRGTPTNQDLREFKNFQRFLRMWPRYKRRMLTGKVWQKYMNISKKQGWAMAKNADQLFPTPSEKDGS